MDMEKISLKVRVAILEKALEYCANYGHPSVVGEVTKKALKESEEVKCSDID